MSLDWLPTYNDKTKDIKQSKDISSLLIKLLGSTYINSGKTREYVLDIMNEVRTCYDVEVLRNIASKFNLVASSRLLQSSSPIGVGYIDSARFQNTNDPEILQNLIMHLGDKIIKTYFTTAGPLVPYES